MPDDEPVTVALDNSDAGFTPTSPAYYSAADVELEHQAIAAALSRLGSWVNPYGDLATINAERAVSLAYAAMEPLIRRQVAEEIAAALEAKAAPKVNPRYQETWVLLPDQAAAIAREIGERHA